jgi:hypothetical protein
MKVRFSAAQSAACAVALLSLAGCASITTGTTQSMSVEARTPSGEQITGANCRLVNSKGTWFVTTPGSVTIHRATMSPLSINCAKDGQQQLGVTDVKPKSKGMTWGNLLFGGVIGVITDGVTGAAGYYPSPITVIMGAVVDIVGSQSNPKPDGASQPSVDSTPAVIQTPPAQPTQAPVLPNQPKTDWRSWGRSGT